jgi:hypothetical protein
MNWIDRLIQRLTGNAHALIKTFPECAVSRTAEERFRPENSNWRSSCYQQDS